MPVMAEQAGIADDKTRLMLNAIITCVSFVGSIIGSTIVDKAGRRKMLFTASCLFVLWFSIIAGLSAKFAGSGNVAGSNAVSNHIHRYKH